MKYAFELSNGQRGSIDLPDIVVDIKGQEWADELVKRKIAELEAEIENKKVKTNNKVQKGVI